MRTNETHELGLKRPNAKSLILSIRKIYIHHLKPRNVHDKSSMIKSFGKKYFHIHQENIYDCIWMEHQKYPYVNTYMEYYTYSISVITNSFIIT